MVRCRSAGAIHAQPHNTVMKTTANMIALRTETSVLKLATIECPKIRINSATVATASPPSFAVDERLGPWSRTEKAAAKKMTNRNCAA